MQQTDVKIHIEQRLPARLIKALYKLAEKYEARGVNLFIFGSFARSKDRSTSDLDIGISWQKKRMPRVFTELYRDVQALPTIRKIDLVDMAQVDEAFKREAMKESIFLSNKNIEYGPDQ